jgi:multidrug resistance efflux pump
MMDIVSTDAVMVQAFLDPSQAQHISEGMEAIVRMPETQQSTRMRVVAVNVSMNADQKAVSVMLSGQTTNGFPKIGQQVQVEMSLGSQQSGASVLRVPLSAIEYEGDAAYVFVQKSATEYEQRRVTVSRILQDEAILANGLTGGERIATNHIFDLKALNRASDYAE